MSALRTAWNSWREARDARRREQEQRSELERLRQLWASWELPWKSLPQTIDPDDLERIVEFLCEEVLLPHSNHRSLCHLVRAPLSMVSLQRIHDTTDLFRDISMNSSLVDHENIPPLVWVEEVRKVHLSESTRTVFRDSYRAPWSLPKDLTVLRLLDSSWPSEDHAGFLALWQEVQAMPEARREIFLSLVEHIDWPTIRRNNGTSLQDMDWEGLAQESRRTVEELRDMSLLM